MATDFRKMWAATRWKRNVVGYSGSIKRRVRDGREHPEYVFRVYVREKARTAEAVADLESAGQLIPRMVDGVPTDIVEVGELRALDCTADVQAHRRPAPAGVSAIAEGCTACTLGWFAIDKLDGELVVICNNHCAAGENRYTAGHPYMQTSPYDSSHGAVERLGELKRFIPIDFGRFNCTYRQAVMRDFNPFYVAASNLVDLAVVSVEEADIDLRNICIEPIRGKRRADEGELLHKCGRTTGYTRDGRLIDNDYVGKIGYSRGTATFGPCGLISKPGFSAGGDSSSAIYTQTDNHFVGLLFAGSTSHTIYCHYDLIEMEGNLEIVW